MVTREKRLKNVELRGHRQRIGQRGEHASERGGGPRGRSGTASAPFFATGRRVEGRPRIGQERQAFPAAEVARLGQRAIERTDGVSRHLLAAIVEAEVGRAEQRHQRRARKGAGHGVEHEVKGRRVWLGGQRQRVERLEWQPGAAEHGTSQI